MDASGNITDFHSHRKRCCLLLFSYLRRFYDFVNNTSKTRSNTSRMQSLFVECVKRLGTQLRFTLGCNLVIHGQLPLILFALLRNCLSSICYRLYMTRTTKPFRLKVNLFKNVMNNSSFQKNEKWKLFHKCAKLFNTQFSTKSADKTMSKLPFLE